MRQLPPRFTLFPYTTLFRSKATHFIQVCCQSRTPLLYLNNTTGYMVGKEYEEAGMIKHGSKMIMPRSEEHTSELQSLRHLVCRLLLEKKKKRCFIDLY